MSNSFKARLFGALFGSSLLALFMIVFRPYDPLCLPVSFLGGIIGIILGALINNIYLNRQKSLSHSIKEFRGLDFFRDKENISDEKLAEMINEEHFALFGEEIDPQCPFLDLLLLAYDKKRVWWEDTEADVLNGNNVYIEFMNDLSRISRGVFSPSEISESWVTDEGPITIEFKLGGEKISINPKYIDDYIDVEIISDINKLIPSEKKFELYKPFDQTAFIIMLSKDEKTRLQKKRGWEFFPF
jgi:hypothetical protein